MNTGRDERFPRSVRIRKRTDYLEVQKRGQKLTSRGFIALLLRRREGPSKLGIITTKRFGCAVKRNRIRRLIRESFRRGMMKLPENVDFVVIPKKNILEFDSKAIFDDLVALGDRARRLVVETNIK